jgi:hypothetical protein
MKRFFQTFHPGPDSVGRLVGRVEAEMAKLPV